MVEEPIRDEIECELEWREKRLKDHAFLREDAEKAAASVSRWKRFMMYAFGRKYFYGLERHRLSGQLSEAYLFQCCECGDYALDIRHGRKSLFCSTCGKRYQIRRI
jgi:hypothetical protein